MTELIRGDYYDSEPVSRQTRKELARINEAARVRQAALEARLREELARTGVDERVAQSQAHERIKGGMTWPTTPSPVRRTSTRRSTSPAVITRPWR